MHMLNAHNLKQYLLLSVIIALVIVSGRQLFLFFPGILGAVTMYILMREKYFRLTVIHNWKKWIAATLFITVAAVIIIIPFIFLLEILRPRFESIFANANVLSQGLESISRRMHRIAPRFSFEESQIRGIMQQAANSLPSMLNTTFTIMSNLLLAFFLLYFMLVEGRKMERKIQEYIPLKEENIETIWQATRNMVISNAIGIPVLGASQALVAGFSYYIFGVEEYILWGVVTGLFSVIPILGTAVIWVPICVYLFATDQAGNGIGLLIYSLVITINIDNVLRFTLLRKLGDIHPAITVLGILVGIPLFGFMGLIFGPLLISYSLLLIKIYRIEFSPPGNSHL